MAQGLYELLGVEASASRDEVREAYQRRLAELVRRRRVAQQQGADVSILESQESTLREAMEILADPARRRRYDAFRGVSGLGIPEDVESLWEHARGALVDPVAGVSIAVVRALTDLPVGDPIPAPPGGWPRARRGVGESVDFGGEAETAAELVTADMPAVLPPAPAEAPTDDHESVRSPPEPSSFPRGLTEAPLPGGAASAPAAAVHHLPPPTEPTPPPKPADPIVALMEQHGPSGAFLRGVRELRGLDVDGLAAATRISTRYLQAIEDDGFDRLPAATFVRGYLRQIVSVLDVEDQGVVEGFMALYSQHR